MLDQISAADAVTLSVCKKRRDNGQLMIAGKHLFIRLRAGVFIHFLDDLGVILNDIGKRILAQNVLPKVVGFDPVRIGRIAGSVTITLVEWQKP